MQDITTYHFWNRYLDTTTAADRSHVISTHRLARQLARQIPHQLTDRLDHLVHPIKDQTFLPSPPCLPGRGPTPTAATPESL